MSGAGEDRGELMLVLDVLSVLQRCFGRVPEHAFRDGAGSGAALVDALGLVEPWLTSDAVTHAVVVVDEGVPARGQWPPGLGEQAQGLRQVLADAGLVEVVTRARVGPLIAGIVAAAQASGVVVDLVTGRPGLTQLTGCQGCTVHLVTATSRSLVQVDAAAAAAMFGVGDPSQIPDLLALAGDVSDRIPNVPGIGRVTAARLVGRYGSVEQLLAAPPADLGRQAATVTAHAAQILSWARLLRISPALDPVVLEDYRRRPATPGGAGQQVLDRWGLHTLTLAPDLDEPALTAPTPLSDDAALAGWLSGRAVVAVATHTGPEGTVLGLVDQESGEAVTVEEDLLGAGWARWVQDGQAGKVTHDGVALHAWCLRRGTPLQGLVADTQVGVHLCDPTLLNPTLEDLAIVTGDTGEDLGAAVTGGQVAAAAAQSTARGWARLSRTLGPRRDLLDLELAAGQVLAGMQTTGIGADRATLTELQTALGAEADQARRQALDTLGEPDPSSINLSSAEQVQQILYGRLGLTPPGPARGSWTTDHATLLDLQDSTGHPFLTHLLTYRAAIVRHDRAAGLLQQIGADERIHPRFHQCGTVTGRHACSGPNLQAITARLRVGFVPGPGYETILTADYTQIELRVLAHLSGDPDLIAALTAGTDIHQATAALMFGLDPDQVTPHLRAQVKATTFGLVYGATTVGLARQLRIPPAQARDLRDRWFAQFPGVRAWMTGSITQARARGHTLTLAGRRRPLPDLTSPRRAARHAAERAALNTPIQGSAAEILKQAMTTVHTALQQQGLRSRLVLQVHDELVLEIAPGELDAARTLTTHAMAKTVDLQVPFTVNTGTGTTWAEAAH